jgi:Flp pilus assembly protein TadB
MTGLAVLAAMLAAALIGRPRRPARQRVSSILTASGSVSPTAPTAPTAAAAPSGSQEGAVDARGGEQPARPGSSVRLVLAVGVLAAGVWGISGPLGVVAGVAGAFAVVLLRPPSTASSPNPDDVPVVVDLISGCLAAGAAMPDALDAAAVAAGVPLRDACHKVAGALRAGLPPSDAWAPWLGDPWLAPVARTAQRTAQTGAGAAEDLRRTSTRLRARRRSAAQHRVRQASVWLVIPLGLCFLPAFLLVSVVPLVVGLLPALR